MTVPLQCSARKDQTVLNLPRFVSGHVTLVSPYFSQVAIYVSLLFVSKETHEARVLRVQKNSKVVGQKQKLLQTTGGRHRYVLTAAYPAT